MKPSNKIQLSGLLLVLSMLLLQGCATSASKSAGMRNMLNQGRVDHALMEVEKESESDDVMVNMNLGVLRAMNGHFETSNQALEKAKNKIQDLYSTSLTEQAAAVLVNDETISFDGDRYEQVLVHAYKALNYISLGDLDAARVEILQSDVKMMEWGEAPEEDPFMRYLAGIVFEALGEEDDATVMYRKAVKVYQATKSRHGLNIPVQLKKDLLHLLARARLWGEYKHYKRQFSLNDYKLPDTRGKGEVVLIMHNGLAPQREQKTIRTYAYALALNVKVALPAYPKPPAYVAQMRVSSDELTQNLETVENIDGLARAALSDDIALITTRAVARAVAKKSAEKKIGDEGNMLGQFAMMVVNQATEIADTRCWNTLPQEIQLSRMYLPQGVHNLKVEVFGRRGRVIDTLNIPVVVKAGRKTIVNKFWTAPSAVTTASVLHNPVSSK